MPTYRTGNMWDESHNSYDPLQVFLATTNSVVHNGELFMGAGSAFELASRYPYAPRLFASMIEKQRTNFDPFVDYLLLIHGKIGALQTKRHCNQPSPIDLVKASVERLGIVAEAMNATVFHCPMPGVGLGRLSQDEAKPLLDTYLGENVHIWTYN